MRKSIQTAILETANGLARAGLMRDITLRELNALSVAPLKSLSPTQIRKIRRANHVSQAVFARVLNTSVSTIQKWEAGDKKPGGPSLKLLHVVKDKGLQAVA